MRCDFYFCTILSKLSRVQGTQNGFRFGFFPAGIRGVHVFELFMTFHLLLGLWFDTGAECLCGFSE